MTSVHSSKSHVLGQSSFSRPASLALESAAFVADLGASATLFFLAVRLGNVSLVPGPLWAVSLVLLHTFAWFAQRLTTGTTLGETIWALRFRGICADFPQNLRGQVFRQDGLNRFRIFGAILLTLAAWTCAGSIASSAYNSQPHWRVAEQWKILPFLPADLSTAAAGNAPVPGDGGERWTVAPFFYSLGAWPTTFLKKPVLYSLPYEKGPPSRFLGRIYARWVSPEIDLLFEGPKTPLAEGGTQLPRQDIQRCLQQHPLRSGVTSCLRLRETVLRRHFDEMRKSDTTEWQLKWFSVDNPALPASEQAQGIFVHARGSSHQESRFVLITPRGTHQAIILKGSRSPQGASTELLHAQQLLESAIGSLRMSDSLDAGRAWVDRQLSSVRLDKLPDPGASGNFLFELARIQSLLVSKLSVDPKTFDTYYHLAGAAWLLIRSGASKGNAEWTAAATPLMESLYRYGQDVLPADTKRPPKLIELENLWIEAKKFSAKNVR